MSKLTSHRVYSTGGVLGGFERSGVVASFSKICKVPHEKAMTYIDERNLVSNHESEADAQKYYTRLTAIGLPVVIEEAQPIGAVGVQPPAEAMQISATGIMPVTLSEFFCPKCLLKQSKSEQCTGCGIFFSKIVSKANGADDPRAESAKRSVDQSDRTLTAMRFILPIMAAVVGAFAWKIIALSAGYEYGLLAWVIGGVVGAAAVFSGSKGTMSGGVCAVLALLSILLGKYLVVADYKAEMEEILSGGFGEAVVQEIYEETEFEAAAFERIDKDDASIKNFMVEYSYTDADAVMSVTTDELEYFIEHTQPWLEERYSQREDETAEYAIPDMAAAFSEVSSLSIMLETIGLIDLLFLFFGVSTAFKLGRSGFDSQA